METKKLITASEEVNRAKKRISQRLFKKIKREIDLINLLFPILFL